MNTENSNTVHGLKVKFVFFVLLAILLIPSMYFIVQSYFQLSSILISINETPKLKTLSLLTEKGEVVNQSIYSIKSRVSLEHDVMVYRHQRTTAFLATRTWMRFMSLIFGAILVVIGSGFVLGRITSPAFTGELSFKELGASVATSSPGLLLVICGLVLIAIPNLSNQRIETNDSSSYISKEGGSVEVNEQQMSDTISDIRRRYNFNGR